MSRGWMRRFPVGPYPSNPTLVSCLWKPPSMVLSWSISKFPVWVWYRSIRCGVRALGSVTTVILQPSMLSGRWMTLFLGMGLRARSGVVCGVNMRFWGMCRDPSDSGLFKNKLRDSRPEVGATLEPAVSVKSGVCAFLSGRRMRPPAGVGD